jgi:hypothetical protein
VPQRGIGTVEIETDGAVEVVLSVTTEDIDYGSIRGVDFSWDQSGAVAFPAVEEIDLDCQAVPALDADDWTSGPLLFAGLDAPSAGRYQLNIQHNCDHQLTFVVSPVEATRTPQAAIGHWSSGWLPNDAGWAETTWAEPSAFLSVEDDGRMAYCLVFAEDSMDASELQWEPRGEGSIGIRRPSGETSEPRIWLVDDRLILIDSSVGAMVAWLGGFSAAASSPGSASGWTADWGDVFVQRSASERPESC